MLEPNSDAGGRPVVGDRGDRLSTVTIPAGAGLPEYHADFVVVGPPGRRGFFFDALRAGGPPAESFLDRTFGYGCGLLVREERQPPAVQAFYSVCRAIARSWNSGHAGIGRTFAHPEDFLSRDRTRLLVPGSDESRRKRRSGNATARRIATELLRQAPLALAGSGGEGTTRVARLLGQSKETNDATLIPGMVYVAAALDEAAWVRAAARPRGAPTPTALGPESAAASRTARVDPAQLRTSWVLPVDFRPVPGTLATPRLDGLLRFDPTIDTPRAWDPARAARDVRRSLIATDCDDEDFRDLLAEEGFFQRFYDQIASRVGRPPDEFDRWLQVEREHGFRFTVGFPGDRTAEHRSRLARTAYSLLIWNSYLAMGRAFGVVAAALKVRIDDGDGGWVSAAGDAAGPGGSGPFADEVYRVLYFPLWTFGGVPLALLHPPGRHWLRPAWDPLIRAVRANADPAPRTPGHDEPADQADAMGALVGALGLFGELVRERRTEDRDRRVRPEDRPVYRAAARRGRSRTSVVVGKFHQAGDEAGAEPDGS